MTVEPPARIAPHTPLRPLWLCRTCGTPWPCATARLTLIAEYRNDRAGMTIYLATILQEATADLRRLNPEPGPAPAELYARFVGWTRRRAGQGHQDGGAAPG